MHDNTILFVAASAGLVGGVLGTAAAVLYTAWYSITNRYTWKDGVTKRDKFRTLLSYTRRNTDWSTVVRGGAAFTASMAVAAVALTIFAIGLAHVL